MAKKLSKVRRYIPKFGGNEKAPEGEQIIAKMKNVDVYTRQTYLHRFSQMDTDKMMQEFNTEGGSKEIKDLLFANVVGFDNFLLEEENPETGEVKSRPATIQDVWSEGEFGLCLELFMDIIGSTQLSKDEAKNSASQSGSTPESKELEEQVH